MFNLIFIYSFFYTAFNDDCNIFDTDMEYIIPLYQRAYAWEDKQLIQLIEDINDVDIVIRYEANRSITTDDIYSMIDDMADAGQDVIALVFDYIKRIRPAERGKDEKEELKNITNELKTLATHYDIPVISAHQMNRDAAATVDAAMQANKADLAKFLGRSNVGSALIFGAFVSEMIHSVISLIAGINSLSYNY